MGTQAVISSPSFQLLSPHLASLGLPRVNSRRASPQLAAATQRGCTHIPWLLSNPQERRKQSHDCEG